MRKQIQQPDPIRRCGASRSLPPIVYRPPNAPSLPNNPTRATNIRLPTSPRCFRRCLQNPLVGVTRHPAPRRHDPGSTPRRRKQNTARPAACPPHLDNKIAARGTGPIKQPSPRATEKNRTAELARTELRRHRAAHNGPGSSRGGPTARNRTSLRVAVFQPHAQTEPKHVAMQAKTPKPRRPKVPKTHRKHIGPCAGPIRARHELPVPSPSCCVPRPARSCVVRCHRRFAPRPESPADSWAG